MQTGSLKASQIRLDNEGNRITQVFTDIKCNKMPSQRQHDLIVSCLEYAIDHSMFTERCFSKCYHKFNGVNQINPEYILNEEE